MMELNMRLIVSLGLILLFASLASAQQKKITVTELRDKDAAWYATDEGQKIVDHILAWQMPQGGWHKAYDVGRMPRENEKVEAGWESATIDNDATYTEVRAL